MDLDCFLHHIKAKNPNSMVLITGLAWASLDNQPTILGISRSSQLRQKFYQYLVGKLHQAYRSLGLDLLVLTKLQTDLPGLLRDLAITHLAYQPLGGWEEHKEEQALVQLAGELNILLVPLPWNTLIQPDELPITLVTYPGQSSMPRTFTPFRKLVEQKPLDQYRFGQSAPINCIPRNITPLPLVNHLKQETQANLANHSKGLQQHQMNQLLDCLEARTGVDRLHTWFDQSLAPSTYKETRNGMGPGNYSSKLSPWLTFGTLQAGQVGKKVLDYQQVHGANESTYWILFELLWRDFFRFLGTEIGPLMYRPKGFKQRSSPGLQDSLPWKYMAGYVDSHLYSTEPNRLEPNRPEPADQTSMKPWAMATNNGLGDYKSYGQDLWNRFLRWTTGNTGQPLVDSAMKELAHRGTLSNRLRQCVASWLIYDLALPWWWGALWFEHNLLDYDPDSNWGNWAYLAGVGADPQESRRFNLEKQQQTYDPKGEYIQWVAQQPWNQPDATWIDRSELPAEIPLTAFQ
jgi:deoxyribodipyrimidine photo-lyase